ncbi:M23 family metallopeptidase [Halarcobacter sp.]|uniref:M23 family metallopeptidase n=1 Tax=Halarcobacter sp. TaxID=2321133 RepID=UPI002AA6E5E5|nr:M23 family metallopeptidase [Halarcobacter sp.]
MKKILLILISFFIVLNGIEIKPKNVKNANTALLILEEKNIKNPKLTFDSQNIDFYSYPNKKDKYYALIPISYYKEKKDFRIIISYIKNEKKVFKGITINVIDGKYKSETINVSKGKVTLSIKNKARVQKEYEEAMSIYKTVSPKLYLKEKFIYPINSKITSEFGTKRVYNGTLKSYHSGTDFKAKIGTKIKAVNDGIVVLSKNRFYAGNSIVIDHGQGIYSCYYHLSKLNLKIGQKVKKGEVVGLSGDTGRVTGPHLHFAFRVHGIQVDPLQLITLINKNNIY